jgi:hypothetical protein
MKYKLSIEAISDYTQMSIMAGELYLIDENNTKSYLCNMVLENYIFIDNDTKIVIPVLRNIPVNGVNNMCMQIGIANIEKQSINFYDKYFKNNGERITYEKEIVTVHNENNEFTKTDILDISTTSIQRSERFEIGSSSFVSVPSYDIIEDVHSKSEKDLYTHINQIMVRPALYLGETSITALWHYINGYLSACFINDIENTLIPRWDLFHEFVKRKTNFYESTGGWKYMILTQCEGNEEQAINLFFEYFNEFLKGEELNAFIKTLVPKDKHDMDFDKITDFYWYNYAELKPIIPELLKWLQDLNYPVAKPISQHLKTMLPDIITDLIPILESEDGIWKYNILQVFFIETPSDHYLKIEELIKKLAYSPTDNDIKEEVNLLAIEILETK